MSPEDLYEIIKGATQMMIEKWSNDCITKPDEFREKISFVKEIVENDGAMTIKNKEIKI